MSSTCASISSAPLPSSVRLAPLRFRLEPLPRAMVIQPSSALPVAPMPVITTVQPSKVSAAPRSAMPLPAKVML